jgi:hypothetical protein
LREKWDSPRRPIANGTSAGAAIGAMMMIARMAAETSTVMWNAGVKYLRRKIRKLLAKNTVAIRHDPTDHQGQRAAGSAALRGRLGSKAHRFPEPCALLATFPPPQVLHRGRRGRIRVET